MKSIFSKNLILAFVVLTALTAGTALLAGYVDGSDQGPQVASACKCADCPKADTGDCCKEGGNCENCEGCASACGQGTCAAKPTAGCGQANAQPASGCGMGYPSQVQGPCGAGGCCPAK